MKLFWSSRSPYVRKVMILLHETGRVDAVETVPTQVAAHAPSVDLMRINPLGKLPTLLLDDGRALFDSRVICEFLDRDHDRHPMFPPDRTERIAALRWQALGDGMLDFLLQWRMELARPESLRSSPLLDAFAVKAAACLDALECEASELDQTPFSIGHIAVGVALGYLDFRFPAYDWRSGRASISAWHRAFSDRPSVRATEAIDD